MILFRADANPNIGMGHIMRCLSIADAMAATSNSTILPRGRQDIKFVLADNSISLLICSRGYEPIILHTDYKSMDSEIPVWEELSSSIDADLLIIDSYFVTPTYLTWLKDNIGRVCYIDDVLSFPYPVDVLVDYNVYANLPDYQTLYEGCEDKPEFLLGVEYAPLRSMFQNIPAWEQKETVTDILLSTGGSDELHIALEFVKYLHNQGGDGRTYHILLGAMNQDKPAIREMSEKMDWIVLHENVVDMKSLICSMDVVVSAAGSTLYEICACGVPLITFSTADNQIRGAEAFEKLGLAINVGDLREPESIKRGVVISGTIDSQAIEKMITYSLTTEARVKMSKRQRAIIDGHGAERLAEALFEKVDIRTI